MKRYWLSILILAAGLACIVVVPGGDPMNFLDIPSLIIVVVTPLLFVTILYGFKETRRAFTIFRKKENEHGTLLAALVFFKTYSKATWIAAFIAAFTGLIAIWVDMENKAVIGPNMALAIVSLFYSGVVQLAVIIPHTVLIHKQLGNGKIRGDILSLFGSLFGVIFISLLLLSLFIPFSSAEQSEDFEIGKVLEKYNGSAANVTIPKGVTSIGYWAFEGCSNLVSVTIPSSVTEIGVGAFKGCESLTSITVDSQNPEYSSVDGVLFNKDITELVTYPTGKQEGKYTIPSSVTSIVYSAFEGCESLTSVTIPSSVTYIGFGAFTGCSSLTSVIIPSSVTEIGWRAFQGCSSLTSVIIPEGVTSIRDNAFRGCNSLTSVTVDSQNPVYSSVDGVLFNKHITNLITYPAGKQESTYTIPSSVTEIGDSAFEGCSILTSVTIPSSVNSIGNSAFEGCSNLASITIPSSVTSIGYSAFQGCSSLTSVIIPSSVTKIWFGAFTGCSSLVSVTIPSSVTEIGWRVFEGCESLTSITVNSQNPVYSSVDGVLFSKDRTDLIVYPVGKQESTYTIPSSVTYIGDNAFSNCSNLTAITIPSSVTYIGDNAFSNCSNLTAITVPSSVTYIGNGAFDGCESLTSITVSRKTIIGEDAFPDGVQITYSD